MAQCLSKPQTPLPRSARDLSTRYNDHRRTRIPNTGGSSGLLISIAALPDQPACGYSRAAAQMQEPRAEFAKPVDSRFHVSRKARSAAGLPRPQRLQAGRLWPATLHGSQRVRIAWQQCLDWEAPPPRLSLEQAQLL